jgi:hypothetical protein
MVSKQEDLKFSKLRITHDSQLSVNLSDVSLHEAACDVS